MATAPRTASVILFRESGKYYTIESWRVPEGAISPAEMAESPDFRRINGGKVLVTTDAQEEFPADRNWGVPHIL